MVHVRMFAIFIFAVVLAVSCGETPPQVPIRPEADISPNVQENVVAKAIRDLALDVSVSLWNQYFTENVVYSPLSIGSLMSLLLLGSRGLSFEQLKKALFFPENVTDAVIHETFQYIIGSLETGKDVQLNISTRIFIQEGIEVEGTYKQIAQALYDAHITPVDFRNNPGKTLLEINRWIFQSTAGKIHQVSSSPFQTDTTMVAVNTILFNGPWENPFDPVLTKDGWFNTGKYNISVPMMNNIMRVRFLEKHHYGFDLIALPYVGQRYSLYIVMPRGRPGIFSLVNMENRLINLPLIDIIGQMKDTVVNVTIPKMRMQFRDSFRKYFEDLGAIAIFDPRQSNFGRMAPKHTLAVSDVIHESVLEITESGTVAAAATVATANRLRPIEFTFNKPSLLFIRDDTNGLILFWGRVVEPNLV